MAKHIPVLKKEILDKFSYLPSEGIFLDGTLGLAGHSIALIKNSERKFKIIGLDRDQAALDLAENEIKNSGLENRFILLHENYSNVIQALNELRIDKIDGALLDLGVSSMQLDQKARGFSFEDINASLDMRMDQNQKIDAKYILNYYPESEIEKILQEYGEEKFARIIARNICKTRKEKLFNLVGDLLSVLQVSIPKKIQATSKKHYATNVFRALRIEVNDELKPLEKTILDIVSVLKPKSKLAVITFHSTEDRIVKNVFRDLARVCSCPENAPICTCDRKAEVILLNKKPIIATNEEIAENPRSRSAKLRVIEKC